MTEQGWAGVTVEASLLAESVSSHMSAGTEMTSQPQTLYLPFTQSPPLGSNSQRESHSNLRLSLPFSVRAGEQWGLVVGAKAALSLWEVGEMNVLEAKFLAASLLQII